MNEDVIKPFPCKETDCGMSFFTEDHLTVHYQAKHSKLNLEIPKGTNLIFADQTPTPTRLLNNCEELRVFDDLQNINPFEEHFRRATEDNSNGIVRDNSFLTTPSANQDTLHTPQILPQINNLPAKNVPKAETIQEPENLTSVSSTEKSINIPNTSQHTETSINDLKNSRKPPIPLLPQPSIIYAAPIITTATNLQMTENHISKTNASVKDKLKNIILNNNGSQIDKKRIKTESVPTIFIGSVPLVATAANLFTNSNNSSNYNFKRSSDEATHPNNLTNKSSESGNGSRKRTRGEKSETLNLKVERNRAAARRYRTKMKIQSQALQEKYDKSQRELTSLKKELSDLKKELTKVKTLLLHHKDCPVSKAMS